MKPKFMIWIFIILSLVILNVLLLIFSSNECDSAYKSSKPKFNMPEKNDIIAQPIMADK